MAVYVAAGKQVIIAARRIHWLDRLCQFGIQVTESVR